MIYWIANIFILVSTLLDIYAVYGQIKKTNHCESSADVSTSFYYRKVLKDLFAIGAILIYQQWISLCLWCPGFIAYIVAYFIIIKNKPANWEPNWFEKRIQKLFYV